MKTGLLHRRKERVSAEAGAEPSCQVIPAPSVPVVASGSPLHRHTSPGPQEKGAVQVGSRCLPWQVPQES